MAPQALFPNDLEASSARSNLTCKPAPPKCQTSPDGATTTHPSAGKDFAMFSTPTFPEQHTFSPLLHWTGSSRGFENLLTTADAPQEQDNSWANVTLPPTFIANDITGEQSDNDSGFSDTSSDTTSLDSETLESFTRDEDYLSLYDKKKLLERKARTHKAVQALRKHYAQSSLQYLHLEPFNGNPHKAIELGAGTCLWASDFGDAYPTAEVDAIDSDIIALNHACKTVSPMVRCIVDDVEESWTFKESSLDFVRAGHLLHSIKNRPRLFARSRRSLQPLCWAEFIGFHYVPHAENGSEAENALYDFYQRLAARSEADLDLNAITKTCEELISAGFDNVREQVLKMPIGGWMEDPKLKEIGEQFQLVLNSAIPHMAMQEGLDDPMLMILAAQAKQSLGSPMYFPLYIVTGQKPAS